MKILIFGKGQFAQAYIEFFSKQSGFEARLAPSGTDIRDLKAVSAAIAVAKPDVVINTAAKTNLDWCEQNKLECFDTNTLGADTVGQACQELGVRLVHISTGCIQASATAEEAHKEDDPPTPTSFYSWTKYWADQMLLLRKNRDGLKLLILRPRQPVSAQASPRNALVKLLTYTKFIDTPNSMTVVEDFVEVTKQLIEKNASGLYNVANAGIMTPYRLALLLKEFVKPDLQVTKISKEELNAMTFAKRIDSVLDCSKLEAEGIKLKDAETRLRELMPVFKENLSLAEEVLKATQAETEKKLSLTRK